MRIAVNLRLYVRGKIGGIENYVRQVVRGIAAHQTSQNQDWTVFAHESEVANVEEIAPGARIIPVVHETAVQVIEKELRRGDYDVLFCPLLVLDPLRPKIPSAVNIPDLQHEFFPEFFDYNTLHWRYQTYRPSVFHANIIFTLSEFSKESIVERFRADPEKIIVVPLAADEEFKTAAPPEAEAAFAELNLFDNYVYYPANFWPHKNHSNLLHAIRSLVARDYPRLGLVLTGAPSTGVDRIKKEISVLGLQENIRILGYQETSVVAEIYRHSKALVFISRFEGFGIPILEAFHTGTPVVCSGAASLPELAGDAAVMVDETSPDSIAGGIRVILQDEQLCRELVAKGSRRSQNYRWDKAVDLTLEYLGRIAQNQPVPPVEIHEFPLVSIVTPSYNMGCFLEETIQSVLTQDYAHIDYIVMDGGSTDGTLDILRKYDGRIRYQSQADRGQADAINRGFALSQGPIFTFLNADDTYLPGAIGTAVRQMLGNKSVGAVYGEAYHVSEDGQTIARYPTYPFDFALLNRNCFICQPAAFMWRDAFIAAGGMNPDLQYALDYDLWIRMAKIYPFQKIDDYLATSRMYAENKTLGKRRQVYKEIMSVAKAHYGYIPYDWVYGYACFLIDGKDQFFEPIRPSLSKYALTLLLGCWYNRTQGVRFGKEWAMQLGIGGKFKGRWEDGWISKEFEGEFPIGKDCDRICIVGKHLAPIKTDLILTILLNDRRVDKRHLHTHGPFTIELDCPHAVRGTKSIVSIQSNKTFHPIKTGDYRKLSCVIDSITFEESRGHS